MRRPACALLIGLAALLVFGNCGTSVRGVLNGVGGAERAAMRRIFEQNRQLRATARQRLHGPARRDEYDRIEHLTNLRLDSLLAGQEFSRSKVAHRTLKVERRLRRRAN